MKKTDAEQKFEQYREHLEVETSRLSGYVQLHKHLCERKRDRLDEMNLACGFFRTVFDALFSVMVLWVNNLLDPHGQRSFPDFLKFVGSNQQIFTLSRLQERRGYPDDHWMLKRYSPITAQSIEADRDKLRNLKALPYFKRRRDKFHAHFDKEYAFERKKISSDAPLRMSDFEDAVAIMKDILNTYSAAYDGAVYSLTPMNIHDIDAVLDILFEHNQRMGREESQEGNYGGN